MLDDHPPHGKLHGVGDFLLHILEGCVERQHQRHLVHEAETGMRHEIEENAQQIGSLRQQVKDEIAQLDQNLDVLHELKADPKATHRQMSFTFRMQGFDEVTWKTAQTTGALGYTPYADAELYSGIYDTQSALEGQQKGVVDGVMSAASIVSTKKDSETPTPAEIGLMGERIGMVELRLLLLNSYIDGLDRKYQHFAEEHSGKR